MDVKIGCHLDIFKSFVDKLFHYFTELAPDKIPTEDRITLKFNENNEPYPSSDKRISFVELIENCFAEISTWSEFVNLANDFLVVDAAGSPFSLTDNHLAINFIISVAYDLYSDSDNTFNVSAEQIDSYYLLYENAIHDENWLVRFSAPIFNVNFETEELEVEENLSIKQIPNEDLKAIFATSYRGHGNSWYSPFLQSIITTSSYRKKGDSSSVPAEVRQNFLCLASAIYIFKKVPILYGPIYEKLVNIKTLYSGTIYSGIGPSLHFPTIPILFKKSEYSSFLDFWKKHKETFKSQRWYQIATERLMQYGNRLYPFDKCVDLVTMFEILLLSGDGELKYRLAVRGAAILADNIARNRTTIFHQLKQLYNLRSALVHNGYISKKEEMKIGGNLSNFITIMESYLFDLFVIYAEHPELREKLDEVVLALK